MKWQFIAASAARYVRYALSSDGWIHIQVFRFKDGDPDAEKRGVALSPDEFAQIILGVKEGVEQ
jgi:uncharacterized alpha-E superfamily protein